MAKTRDVAVVPRNDAYTGLLAISFLALVGATVLMAMDADSLGKPPAPLQIAVPGTTAGKAGEGLKRPDIGGGKAPDTGVPDKDKDKDKGGGGAGAKAEPKELPPLPGIAAAEKPADVVPVKAEAPADPDAPPLPPPSFVPPM
jgi:hypothetical protein